MPSETIYFNGGQHKEIVERVEDSDKNMSEVVRELVYKGLEYEEYEK